MTPGTKLGFAAKRKNRSAKIFHEKKYLRNFRLSFAGEKCQILRKNSIFLKNAKFLRKFIKKTK